MYAAGAVLYEMATGRRPFNATNDAALMNAILRGKPNPPTETNPHISPGLNAIVLKALDLDPSLRYQSATELQVDLNRLSGRAHETIRPGRRNWISATGAFGTSIRPTFRTTGRHAFFSRKPRRRSSAAISSPMQATVRP